MTHFVLNTENAVFCLRKRVFQQAARLSFAFLALHTIIAALFVASWDPVSRADPLFEKVIVVIDYPVCALAIRAGVIFDLYYSRIWLWLLFVGGGGIQWFCIGALVRFVANKLKEPVVKSESGCYKCGYELLGNVSGICPECGTPIDPKQRKRLGDVNSANRETQE